MYVFFTSLVVQTQLTLQSVMVKGFKDSMVLFGWGFCLFMICLVWVFLTPSLLDVISWDRNSYFGV